jgi:hypothetical protein
LVDAIIRGSAIEFKTQPDRLNSKATTALGTMRFRGSAASLAESLRLSGRLSIYLREATPRNWRLKGLSFSTAF